MQIRYARRILAVSEAEGRTRARPGVGVYSPELAARLTTVPRSTLTAWRASGLLLPGLELDLPRARRAYTFDDLGAIMLIRELRGRGLPMQRLRKAVAWFEAEAAHGRPWTNRRVWTDGRDVFVFERDDDADEPLAATRHGQKGFSVLLPDVIEGLAHGSPALRHVGEYVEISPHVQAGQPVLRSTRLTTALVADIAGPEVDIERVRRLYPDVSAEAVRAAVQLEQTLGRLAA